MLVHCSYVELGAGIALIGGSAEPLYGLGIVARNTPSVGVYAAQSDLRDCFALVGQQAVRLLSNFVVALLKYCVSILERTRDGR